MLLVNLAYLGWELNRPVTQRAHASHTNDVPKIVLLRELPGSNPESVAQAKTPPAEKPGAEPADNGSVQAAAEKPKAAAPPAKTTAKAEATQKVEKHEPVATAAVVPAAETPAQAKAPAASKFACYTLGPFRDIADLRKLIRDIRAFVVEAAFRSNEEREQSMYWVNIPPQKSREAANALAAELKRKKIGDFYVVNAGEQANAISLGHFREKAGALSVMKKVKQAGFAVQIDPVFKSYTIYWLDYRVQTDRSIPRSALDLTKLPSIRRFDRSCG